ncbi:hypothetical protein ACJX0J_038088 [Zea mays]
MIALVFEWDWPNNLQLLFHFNMLRLILGMIDRQETTFFIKAHIKVQNKPHTNWLTIMYKCMYKNISRQYFGTLNKGKASDLKYGMYKISSQFTCKTATLYCSIHSINGHNKLENRYEIYHGDDMKKNYYLSMDI